jgi:hypothetical protein
MKALILDYSWNGSTNFIYAVFISSCLPSWHLPALQIKSGPSPCSIKKYKERRCWDPKATV